MYEMDRGPPAMIITGVRYEAIADLSWLAAFCNSNTTNALEADAQC